MTGRGPTPSGSRPQRRYHFHTPGVLYTLVTLLLAIGAFNSQNNLLFASLGLAIGGLLVSGILSGSALLGLRLERLPIEQTHVGGRLVLRYRATNSNRTVPAFGLTLNELPGDTTWQQHAPSIRAYFACVPARGRRSGGRKGSADAEFALEPRRRGAFVLGPVRLWTTFPFGLTKKSITFSIPAATVVHPVQLPVRQGILDKLTVRAHSGVGAAASPGLGDEFYGLREYADGDNPRWIAWRRSARTGQMVVRQNSSPTPRVLWIVVSLRRGDRVERAERAIALASALIRACSHEGASVGLAVPSHGVAMPPRAAHRALGAMLERLATLDVGAGEEPAFPAQAIRGAANVVIHAGTPMTGFGSARSRHVDVGDMNDLLVTGEALSKALALIDGAKESGSRPPGRVRGSASRAERRRSA
jgi:uncharacterized protein (DUF58 family)